MIFDNRNEMEVVSKICQKPCKSHIPVCQRYSFYFVDESARRVVMEALEGESIPEKRSPLPASITSN